MKTLLTILLIAACEFGYGQTPDKRRADSLELELTKLKRGIVELRPVLILYSLGSSTIVHRMNGYLKGDMVVDEKKQPLKKTVKPLVWFPRTENN